MRKSVQSGPGDGARSSQGQVCGLFAVRLEGAEVSGAAIKAMVRRLIEDEPAHAPLADEVIAAMLARQGIRVARRTVAKYREQLSIAPARMRRRERAPAPVVRLG